MNLFSCVLILAIAPALTAQEFESFDKSTELIYVEGEAIGCPPSGAGSSCFQACDRMVMKFEIRRVVGGGMPDVDVDANGALIRPEELIQNGQISETATLKFKIESRSGRLDGWSNPLACSPYWLESEVWVNGKHFDGISVPYCNWLVSETKPILKVPVEALRFARRVEGSEPIPGINMIELRSGHASRVPIECGDHDSNWIGIESARFEATAPVVFIHGMTSDDGWFTQYGFDQEFRKKRIGYAFAGGTAVKSGAAIESLGDGFAQPVAFEKLAPRLRALSLEFGARYFHLLAHSKGGLYARALLDQPANVSEVGVYSLTTLATPHRGSVLADILHAANLAVEDLHGSFWFPWGWRWLVRQVYESFLEDKPYIAWADLSTIALEEWDNRSTFPQTQSVGDNRPHNVIYRAQAGDARRVAGDPNSVDCEGFGPFECRLLDAVMWGLSKLRFITVSGTTIPVPEAPGAPNDLVVHVGSAVGPAKGPAFIQSPLSTPWRHNHTSVGMVDVASALTSLFSLENEGPLHGQ